MMKQAMITLTGLTTLLIGNTALANDAGIITAENFDSKKIVVFELDLGYPVIKREASKDAVLNEEFKYQGDEPRSKSRKKRFLI